MWGTGESFLQPHPWKIAISRETDALQILPIRINFSIHCVDFIEVGRGCRQNFFSILLVYSEPTNFESELSHTYKS